MQVILSSNVTHYHYLAMALDRGGYLKRYITSISPVSGNLPRVLPQRLRRKLEGRRISDIDGQKVRRCWVPELLQRGLPRTGLISGERGNWINNYLFDWMVGRWVDACDFFHFVSSIGLYSARKAKRLGARVICDVRQEHPNFQSRLLQDESRSLGIRVAVSGTLYERKVIEELDIADYIVVPSSYARDTFTAEGYPKERIFVNPYGADPTQFHSERKQDKIFRVLFVGQITARKGVHYLLRAMSELRLRNSELLLVGTADPLFAPVLARFEGTFRHVGDVPKIELIQYYNRSSVLVLPSIADAYALVVLEALACGLPVIVSTNTGSKEMVRDGEDGFVIPIRDVEALKQKILLLYEDPGVRHKMAEAAAQRASQLTWEGYARRALRMYEQFDR